MVDSTQHHHHATWWQQHTWAITHPHPLPSRSTSATYTLHYVLLLLILCANVHWLAFTTCDCPFNNSCHQRTPTLKATATAAMPVSLYPSTYPILTTSDCPNLPSCLQMPSIMHWPCWSPVCYPCSLTVHQTNLHLATSPMYLPNTPCTFGSQYATIHSSWWIDMAPFPIMPLSSLSHGTILPFIIPTVFPHQLLPGHPLPQPPTPTKNTIWDPCDTPINHSMITQLPIYLLQ